MISRLQVYFLFGVTALLLMAQTPAYAQSDLKIGYVNVPFLLQNAPQTVAVEARLRNEFAPRDSELQELAERFQEKLDTWERNASVMSESERNSMQRELETENRDLQRRQETLQEDFNIRQEEELAELQAMIGRQLQAWVQENDYDLVLSNAVYVSEAVDITADVLEAIKEQAED